MRYAGLLILSGALVVPSFAQNDTEGPANEKARKTYQEAFEYLQHRATGAALDSFKKAYKQDDGHCLGCQEKMVKYGVELRDWKTAETAGEEMVAEAKGARDQALAHYDLGTVLMGEALEKHKDDLFARAHEEMTKALGSLCQFSQRGLCGWTNPRAPKPGCCRQSPVRAVCEDEICRRVEPPTRSALHQRSGAGAG